MSNLNLKNEILEATSFEGFRKRIRDYAFNGSDLQSATETLADRYQVYAWRKNIDLLCEAHKMGLVYRSLEKSTDDKAKLQTCMEILDGLENLCSIDDVNKAQHVMNIERDIWKPVTSLQLARQLIAEIHGNNEGYTMDVQVEILEEDSESLTFELDTPNDSVNIFLLLDMPIQNYVTLPSGARGRVYTPFSSYLFEKMAIEASVHVEAKKLYKRYLNEFPFDKSCVLEDRIRLFAPKVKKSLVNEICFILCENDLLSEAQKERILELLFSIEIANELCDFGKIRKG